MFHGGRLFQQWDADMYVKVESMCLDRYSSTPAHQYLNRADLFQVRTFCCEIEVKLNSYSLELLQRFVVKMKLTCYLNSN
jgi:hypothetical protein